MGDNDEYYRGPTTSELNAEIQKLKQQVAKLKKANRVKNKLIASLKSRHTQNPATKPDLSSLATIKLLEEMLKEAVYAHNATFQFRVLHLGALPKNVLARINGGSLIIEKLSRILCPVNADQPLLDAAAQEGHKLWQQFIAMAEAEAVTAMAKK